MKRVCLLFVLLLTVGLQAFAQDTHTVTGKILDENGRGYPGAGITVKGTQLGTISDANGDFMLEVPDGRNIFIIQAVGYATRQVTETDGSIKIILQPTAKELEGTVVTAQAFKREKRELGYATTTLTNDELLSGNSTSALSGLQGKVAGANITSSTSGPGGSTRVVLRGEKSIQKNNNALIVVDGVITNNYDRTRINPNTGDVDELAQVDFGNSGNDIDPEEIESVSVLSGAAGSTLYGSAGANGVIMITTKAGRRSTSSNKASKVDVTYKISYTQSDILKYADLQHTYGQGDLYAGIDDDRRENFSWGYKFDGQMRPWGQAIDGKQLVKPYVDQPGNIKSFFNHGKNLNNFVSLSGGTETSTYYLSLNSINSTGVVPNTFFNKYSIRFNGTTQLSNRIYSGINVNYINSYSRAENSGQSNGSTIDNLYQTARDIPIWELKDYDNANHFYSMQFVDTNGIERYGYYGGYYKNPYWVAKKYDNRNKTDRVVGDFKIGYKKGSFDVFNRTGVDMTSDRSFYKTPNLNAEPVDPFYAGNTYLSTGGYAQNNYAGMRFYNDLIASFTHSLGKNFGINVIMGHNTTIENDERLNAEIDPGTNGLVIPNFYNFSNNVGPVTVANPLRQRRLIGLYGDIKLNYQRELYLEITGRNDWSSTLVQHHNSYFYPGTNASWVFTERLNGSNFKKKVMNYGKVRMGISGVGSDALAYANNAPGYVQGSINSGFGSIIPPFNGVAAYQITNTIGSSSLRPERTRGFEMGTDLSLLNNRISLSFTYYNSLTHDLVTPVAVATSSGFAFQYQNIGDISNKGIELSMRGTPIATKYGLRWEIFGTYTRNISRVESLLDGVDHVTIGGFNGMSIVAAVGKPYGTFYAADIEYWNGHPVVDPVTGLPIATKKPVYRGSFQPKFQASWGTDVTYKGLRFHMLFTTKQGGQYYSQNKLNMDFNGTSPETVVNNREPYVFPNSVYLVPGSTNSYLTNTTRFSPYQYYTNIQNNNLPAQGLVGASYVKLQEMAISYKIPQKYYMRTPFGGLEAGIYGNNLLIWTAESNHYEDPEQTSAGSAGNGQGFGYIARPSLRNYGAFLKVTF